MTINDGAQPSVGILGAGWVGLPLAEHLQKQGVNVLASCQSEQGLQALTSAGVPSTVLSVQVNALEPQDSGLLQQQCIIICIPPGIRYGKGDYPQKIKQIVDAASAVNSKVESLILLSSTAVYNGLQGEVNELSKLDHSAEKVALIAEAEQCVLNSNITHKCVVRLAGLIGYNRQPGKFFSNGRSIPNPDSVVNFIHRDDVIGLLTQLIAVIPTWQQGKAEIINGVIDDHPLRKDFYNIAVAKLAAEKPKFQQQQEIKGKQVNSVNIKQLSYRFIHSNLIQYLDSNEAY